MTDAITARALITNAFATGPAFLLAGRGVQLANGLLLSILLVRVFGLEVVGSFALGIAAVNVIANVCPLGLAAYLPRVQQSHARSAFTGLVLLAAQLPVVLAVVAFYAWGVSRDGSEAMLVVLVALGGYCIALTNTGLMLSIMRERFYPGLLAPLCETVGLFAGVWLARTPLGLAATLLASRFVSAGIVWGGFRFEAVGLRDLHRSARAGANYLLVDVLTILPEQMAPLFLSGFVSRSDLGVFRLCQQLLMAADSPGWSFVQSKYPQLVSGGPESLLRVERDVRKLSVAATGLCAIGSALVAVILMHTAAVAPLMCVLSASLLWRYKSYLYGQAFRASGRLRELSWLVSARLVAVVPLFYLGIWAGGVWGVVGAMVLASVTSAVTFERTYRYRWWGASHARLAARGRA